MVSEGTFAISIRGEAFALAAWFHMSQRIAAIDGDEDKGTTLASIQGLDADPTTSSQPCCHVTLRLQMSN